MKATINNQAIDGTPAKIAQLAYHAILNGQSVHIDSHCWETLNVVKLSDVFVIAVHSLDREAMTSKCELIEIDGDDLVSRTPVEYNISRDGHGKLQLNVGKLKIKVVRESLRVRVINQ